MGGEVNKDRRQFLKVSAALGGGLLVGVYLPARSADQPAPGEAATHGPFAPNAWIRIASDGTITVLVDRSEMGQGVMTSLPMLIAEELEADLGQLRTAFAPAAPAYVNPLLGSQGTGGSTSVRGAWTPLRQAGAVARTLLVRAAAARWGVPEDQCHAAQGEVIHQDSGRRLSYGELAAAAARLPVPEVDSVLLKEPREFRIIGRPTPRLDTPDKVRGVARFGIDVQRPGMLIAGVERCPVFGGKLKGFDATKAKAVVGVKAVVPISSGVAVVGAGFWPVEQGREALAIQWDFGPNASLDSAAITKAFVAAAEKPGVVARAVGDIEAARTGAAKVLEAVYQVPYEAHACMEPMNCTADVREDGCELWVPTQGQTRAQLTAAKITGLPQDKVTVHTTFLGGGFGRRAEADFVAEAVELSKAVKAPVKVLWTRADDTHHDFYRPATYNRLRAMLDPAGNLIGWQHRIVGPSILARLRSSAGKDGIDRTSVEGAANIPYGVPNIHVDYVLSDPGVPVGFWRSVGSSQNAFIVECFLDEVAAAAGQDPVALRRELLGDAPRHLRVLDLAADKAGWGEPLPKGHGRGVAVHQSFASYVAQVAEVSVAESGAVQVHRVVCAVDCGSVVNPSTVEAQMESAIVFGLTAALKSAITIDQGRVAQSNFNDFPLLAISEMPHVEVHIVKTDQPPGGVGEPGTPPIAPAVANAIFAATGKRVRHLPIRPEDLAQS